MTKFTRRFQIGAMVLLAIFAVAFAQISSTSSINGTVRDNTSAVVPGAEITVTNTQTGTTYKALTNDEGAYNVPALPVGIYKVSVSVPGFKTAVVDNVKLELTVPSTVNISLAVGDIAEAVTVVGGAEVIQTSSTNIATTITGRQIVDLPFTSRDALDLILFLPGVVTNGRPRQSSVQGLPKGALNITTDGVNVQDNVLKGSDGFFTYIRPKIDAIEQVTISTATPGAEAAGGGAVQIQFVTRAGSNNFDGSVYWYRRTTGLNSNFFFNNQTATPRATNNLLQLGFRVGGPILKNKLFFFANYEEFRLPEAATRTRTILAPASEKGVFVYTGGPAGGVDLLALAAKNGFTSTLDPITSKILSDIRASTSQGTIAPLTDPLLQRFTFTNQGGQLRRFPTLRIDWELTSKHHIENIYNYNEFASKMDFLNGADPAYPGSPIFGSQSSNRFSNVTAWRWTVTPTIVNEARFGLVGGTVVFFPEVGSDSYKAPLFGGTSFAFPLGLSTPNTVTGPQRRNAPVYQFLDAVHWTRATHSMSYGFNATKVKTWLEFITRGQIPQTSFGVNDIDPAAAMFNTTNFPGATTAQLSNARSLYALTTGLIAQVTRAAAVVGDKYDVNSASDSHDYQRVFAVYGQDAWKMTPNLTLNYGLRWEPLLPFVHENGVYTTGPFSDLYGVSGLGNLFKPGTLTGRVPQFVQVTPDYRAFQRSYNHFAPSFGFAWSPKVENSLLKAMFGESGKSVIRGAYSIAFNAEGTNIISSIVGSNPGAGTLTATRAVSVGNLPPQTYFRAGLPPPPFTTQPRVFPVLPSLSDSVNYFNPNLGKGYVESWTFGVQRELNRDTAIEVRYVGNRGIKLGRQYNINEVNIFENGFLDEFKKAQQNLAVNIANGRGSSFANNALPGQSALPIFQASFGTATANFTNGTFVSQLQQGQAGGLANTLATTASFQNNRVNAGLASNLFLVNPSVFGGAFMVDNGSRSSYDGMQIDLRRRMSKGLLLQANYTLARALSNAFGSSSVNFAGYTTLRDVGYENGISPFDVRHAFKMNWIYDMPFGPGTRWQAGNGLVNRVIGGWAVHGTSRIQSGRPHLLTSGRFTSNQNDSGVVLIGLTQGDLQRAMKITGASAASGNLFYFPQDLINGSLQAFGLVPGTPSGPFISPQLTPGTLGQRIFLYGPHFQRWDISLVKKTMITEKTNLELRVEFLNAFNESNIMLGSPASDVSTIAVNSQAGFGQTGFAYQDLSTTNDPGGRMIQFVARFNF
ncbi:MAG TPA: TonB-dependent receptor [Acidobacteriota bacterium]|nr:TonB-dependent receptor [Acidobacteriota bacterium]